MIQSVVLLVGAMAGVSLAVGGVLALAVVIWAQDITSALRIIHNGYYALIGLLPIVMWLTLYAMRDDEDYEAAYDSPLRSMWTAVQGATVGSILGGGPIFLTVVINLPVILAGFEMNDFGPAVRDAIVWSPLLLAVGAAVASAIPLGLWVHHTGSGRQEERQEE